MLAYHPPSSPAPGKSPSEVPAPLNEERFPGGKTFFLEWLRLSQINPRPLSHLERRALKETLAGYELTYARIKKEESQEVQAHAIEWYTSKEYRDERAMIVRHIAKMGALGDEEVKEWEEDLKKEDEYVQRSIGGGSSSDEAK